MKNLIILLIFAILTTACEKSTLKITYPNDNFFLNKMTGWTGLTVDNGGKTITIAGKGDYTFEKKITGLAGIYKKSDNEYMFVLPAGDEAHTVTVNATEKKALEEIINIVGEENSGSIIQEILSNDQKLDANSIAKNFPDKKSAIESVINNLYSGSDENKTNFGNYKVYPEKTN